MGGVWDVNPYEGMGGRLKEGVGGRGIFCVCFRERYTSISRRSYMFIE